ncbi:efflux RND transporter periplasmic adaptor subunit [Rubritalea spongiae]|uniref:Efflux RND transporter periplasmic adaptor subunit n=1 Tax=Rubritalea spongiae TaxID=430797 RepID=A0ABW5E1C8_9BACT
MKTILKIVLPVLLIALSVFAAKTIVDNKKPRKSKQPPAVIPSVSIITVNSQDHSPPIHSYGTVKSFFETNLSPQVNGQITYVSPKFRVGEAIPQGTVLAKIDSTDYEAILARELATLTTNKRTLEEETILAQQAKQDWLASGRNLETASPFVLRQPQLAAAKANIASSKAAINKAQADIDRCSISAPFDAVIASRDASLGNYATIQSSLGTLVATDHAEVHLPLTPEQLKRIQLNKEIKEDYTITLTSPTKPSATWQAKLTRINPVIDPRNQVVFVIAEIDKPYDTKNPLPVGTFVNASIPATPVSAAFKIPETALINDSFLWAVDTDSKLLRIPVTRIYSFEESAYVTPTDSSIQSPLKIVSRPLTNFRHGMEVKPLPQDS